MINLREHTSDHMQLNYRMRWTMKQYLYPAYDEIDCIFVYYFLDLRVVRTTSSSSWRSWAHTYLLRTAQPPHAPSRTSKAVASGRFSSVFGFDYFRHFIIAVTDFQVKVSPGPLSAFGIGSQSQSLVALAYASAKSKSWHFYIIPGPPPNF
jgi:hypothetical protein